MVVLGESAAQTRATIRGSSRAYRSRVAAVVVLLLNTAAWIQLEVTCIRCGAIVYLQAIEVTKKSIVLIRIAIWHSAVMELLRPFGGKVVRCSLHVIVGFG